MAKQIKPPKKPKKVTDMRENGGRVMINLGQIIFGTLFLGSVMRGEIPHYVMMMSGILGAFLFIIVGLLASAKEKKDKEE